MENTGYARVDFRKQLSRGIYIGKVIVFFECGINRLLLSARAHTTYCGVQILLHICRFVKKKRKPNIFGLNILYIRFQCILDTIFSACLSILWKQKIKISQLVILKLIMRPAPSMRSRPEDQSGAPKKECTLTFSNFIAASLTPSELAVRTTLPAI